jgi:hypothetical protein
MKWLK